MILKQSTAITFRIGPFVDDTDFKTPETTLSIGQADIQISKAGGAFAQTSDAAPTTTHDSDGWYQCPLTATDTNTLGLLTVQIAMSGALPVWLHFMVIPANVYDSLIGGSDSLEVDAVAINGSTTAAGNMAAAAETMQQGTVDDTAFTPTTTEFEADDITEANPDQFIGRTVIFTSGTLDGQQAPIEDYALASGRGHFTVTAVTDAPSNDDTFVIV